MVTLLSRLSLTLGVWVSFVGGSSYHSLCGQAESYIASGYIVNNNAWNEDDSGSICTYVSPDATTFTSIWTWKTNPATVRAFPNIGIDSSSLPVQISALHTLAISASWTLAPTSLIAGASMNPTTEPDSGAIAANNVQCNVVLDMFADEDEDRSHTSGEQRYEFMVWFGNWGAAAKPIGSSQPNDPAIMVTLGASAFTLYNGTNLNGQSVFSWVSNTTLTVFDLDIAPLLGFLVAHDYLPADAYLGTLQFGSETSFASREINFTVHAFEAIVGSQPTNLYGGTATATATLPVATLISTTASPSPSASGGTELLVRGTRWTTICWGLGAGYYAWSWI